MLGPINNGHPWRIHKVTLDRASTHTLLSTKPFHHRRSNLLLHKLQSSTFYGARSAAIKQTSNKQSVNSEDHSAFLKKKNEQSEDSRLRPPSTQLAHPPDISRFTNTQLAPLTYTQTNKCVRVWGRCVHQLSIGQSLHKSPNTIVHMDPNTTT